MNYIKSVIQNSGSLLSYPPSANLLIVDYCNVVGLVKSVMMITVSYRPVQLCLLTTAPLCPLHCSQCCWLSMSSTVWSQQKRPQRLDTLQIVYSVLVKDGFNAFKLTHLQLFLLQIYCLWILTSNHTCP